MRKPMIEPSDSPEAPAEATTSAANKRQHSRVPVEVDVDFWSESNFYKGFVENISEGGLFVVTWEPKKIGEKVTLKFRLPDSTETIECAGEVRWVRVLNPDTPDVSPGLGVRFVNMSPTQQRRVEEFIREREPLFFDE
jgi:type IV pilus assembly protein PilZ